MLTRCPGCGTSFRITTDQLVSRQGKVRCGRCQQVFSALGSLVHTRDTPAPAPAGPAARPEAAAADTLGLDDAITTQPQPVEAGGAAPDSVAPNSVAPNSVAPGLARRPAEPERKRRRRGRRVAWLWLVGVLAAGTLLAAQAAYFYRDQLAVLEPDAKPWLLRMCAQLQCRIEIPADPQAIAIESSSLEADPGDKTLVQMVALLRNHSALAQNLPHLELTLLDAQETPLARRVLRPADYAGGNPPPLAADSEYQVRLSIDASGLKASGYRLYAFYP